MLGDQVGRLCYEAYEKREARCDGCGVALAFADGNVHRVVRTAPTPDDTLHVEITASPLRDSTGRIIAGIEVVRDITGQVKTAEEHQKLESQLRQSQKMEAVGRLAGGVAHDFNNILSAIIGYGSLMQMKMLEHDPLRANLDEMLRSADRAAQLTHRLLAFSRKQAIQLRPMDLNEIVSNMEHFLRRIIGEDITLESLLANRPVTVNIDAGQIEQVVMNLATNARDAMPRGGTLSIGTDIVEIGDDHVRTHGFDRPGTYGLLTVRDTGVGMNDDTLKHIFEPFFTTKEQGKGTGLGLSMAFGIIQQHKGFIDVSSATGKGTVFSIFLPLIMETPQDRPPARFVAGKKLPRGTETVLVVEDDEVLRKLTRVVLEEFGYTVIEAADGAIGVDRFREQKDAIHLVILDVIMPARNGREAYEEIRNMRADVKALFMSGYAPDRIFKDGILEPGWELLMKPVSPEELLRKVRMVLDA